MIFPRLVIASLLEILPLSKVIFITDGGAPTDADLANLAVLAEEQQVTVTVTIGFAEEGGLKSVGSSEVMKNANELRDCLLVDTADFHQEVQSQSQWFRKDMVWLLPPGHFAGPPAALRFDSNFLTVADGGELLEWYRIKGGPPHSNILGTWDRTAGLHVKNQVVWERRKDMGGATVTVSALPWTFFVMKEPGEEGGRDEYGGLAPDVLRSMQSVSNFTAEWTEPEDGKYGAPGENGTWTGMVGSLRRREVDVAAILAITHERSAVVDYNMAFIESRSTLIVRNPAFFESSGVNFIAFLTVFTPGSWLLVAAMLLAVMAVHLVVSNVFCSGRPRRPRMPSSLSPSAAFGYKSLLKLDLSTVRAPANSRNALFITASAVGVIVSAYYEGTLTSFLTAKLPAPQLTSYFGAVEQGYRVVTLSGAKQVTEFQTATPGSGREAVYLKLMKGKPDALLPDWPSLKEALLSDPRTAMEFSEFAFGNDRRFLPLTWLDEVQVDLLAFALQKDSELLPLFDHNMFRLHQSGTLDFFKEKWVRARVPDLVCDLRFVEDASALGYVNLIFPSLVLSCGCVAAPAVLLLEAVAARLGLKRRRELWSRKGTRATR